MSSTERGKKWDHNEMIWRKWKTNKPIAIEDVVSKAEIRTEWLGFSKAQKEDTMAHVYITLVTQKAVTRTRTKVDGKVKVKSKVQEDKFELKVRHVSYLVKGMTEYGCDKDEALKLWKAVEKKLKAACKEIGQEWGDLDPNPPLVERKGRQSDREMSLKDQVAKWAGKGS